ncbi:MAG: zinc-binding dehydrogenase [Sinobacteraceae bacterium]|nr:zinc-binding dehydrogenase [Nevskiaceae bacterium]
MALLSQHAYAEYEHVAAEAVLKLPPGLAERDFPAEPLGCAMNIFRRCQIEPEHDVAVVGAGFLGALLCALASRAGAKVVALSRRRSARELAERFGAGASVDASDLVRAHRQALQLVARDGFARVIECGGTQESLDLASELTGTRGRLVIAGYHQDGPRRINLQQWNWRGIDVVNAHERDNREYLRGMREAVDLALAGEVDLAALFTHRFPLEELGAAFDAMGRHDPGFVKALVLCA